jgi:hypothetical protein
MLRGDFAQAWRFSERVLRARDPAMRDDPSIPYHMRWVWDGRPFEGRRALVRCYHGLGDTIQFSRFIPLLAQKAASVVVEAQPELIPLLAGLDGVQRFVPFDRGAPLQPSECDVEIMELSFALRARPDAVAPPYLRSEAAAVISGAVGLCWQAGDWEPDRAIPQQLLRGLAPGRCVALVPQATELDVLNPEGCPNEIVETAKWIAGLDLVITVDTMVAHLAGALNRPVWVLLKHRADWRWMADREDSPWYPSMRLYRQPAPGDWESVLARVRRDLSRRLEPG